MTDRPIIFNAAMIRALLDDRKTQTRRVLKSQPASQGFSGRDETWSWPEPVLDDDGMSLMTSDQIRDFGMHIGMAKHQIGDRLWVRETWRPFFPSVDPWNIAVSYDADKSVKHWDWASDADFGDWNTPKAANTGNVPSIHMPRWASRLTLIVTDVRVQRLQEISEADAVAEGAAGYAYETSIGEGYGSGFCCSHGQDLSHRPNEQMFDTAKESFNDLWNFIYGPEAWDDNPWVSATTFTVHRCNIDQMEAA